MKNSEFFLKTIDTLWVIEKQAIRIYNFWCVTLLLETNHFVVYVIPRIWCYYLIYLFFEIRYPNASILKVRLLFVLKALDFCKLYDRHTCNFSKSVDFTRLPAAVFLRILVENIIRIFYNKVIKVIVGILSRKNQQTSLPTALKRWNWWKFKTIYRLSFWLTLTASVWLQF